MEDIITMLGKFPMFDGLTEQQLEKINTQMKVKDYCAGQIVLREGDKGESMYVLLKGKVEVKKSLTHFSDKRSMDKRDKALLHLSEDDHTCFGEMALLSESHKRTATITTLSECTLAKITGSECAEICINDPQLGYILMRNVAKSLSARLERANQDILKLTTAFCLALQ